MVSGEAFDDLMMIWEFFPQSYPVGKRKVSEFKSRGDDAAY